MGKQWRALIAGSALGLAVDAIVAFIFVRVADPYEPWHAGLLFFACLIAGSLFFALYGGLKAVLAVWLFKNGAGARAIAKAMADEGFPPARGYDDANSYLDHIIEHDDYDQRLKVRAAIVKGEKMGAASVGGLVKGYAIHRTFDRAIEFLRPR